MPPKSNPQINELLPSIAELLARADALLARTPDYAKNTDVLVLSTRIEHLKDFLDASMKSLKEIGDSLQIESKSNTAFRTSIQLQIRQLWYAVIVIYMGILVAAWYFVPHVLSGK